MDSRTWTVDRVSLGIGVALLIVGALWLRLFSLCTEPLFDADEAFYGIQVMRLLHGESLEWQTTSGNVTSPLTMAVQVPPTLLLGPSVWSIRLPAALGGVAACLILAWTFRQHGNASTGILAALVLLSLPPAMFFARNGCEYSLTPLVGAIATALAWHGRLRALLAWFAFAVLVHPTNVLLAPWIGPIVLARHLETEGRIFTRRLVRFMIALGLLVLSAVVWASRNPNVQGRLEASRDPLSFLIGFGQFLLGIIGPLVDSPWAWASLAAVILLIAMEITLLTRHRDWSCLAIAAGWLLMLVAFDVGAGADVLRDYAVRRYGAVLLVPTATALAVLTVALLRPSLSSSHPIPRLGGWSLPGLGMAAMLVCAGVNNHQLNRENAFGRLAQLAPDEPFTQAAGHIESSTPRRPKSNPSVVVVQDRFMNGQQMEYLLSDRADLRVIPLVTLHEVWQLRNDPTGEVLRDRRARLAQALGQGGFAVEALGTSFDRGSDQIQRTFQEHFPGEPVSSVIVWPQALHRLQRAELSSAARILQPPAAAVTR